MGLNFFKIAKGLGLKGQSADATSPINGDIYYNSTLNKFRAYENSAWTNVIGAGSSSTNYILNPNADVDTTGWATYANTTHTPDDTQPNNGGTGGSPTVTLTRNTSSPLRDGGDFLFTKDAANRQGEGASYAFSIYNADAPKRLSLSFDWKTSANYASSDMGVYVYDVTNAVLIIPSVSNLPASPSATRIQLFFNASTSTSYRLIFHVKTVNASAYTVNFDGFSVGPQDVVQTMPSSDWTSFTPTGSWTTNTTYTGFWKRVGDSLECEVKVATSGAPTSADLAIDIPFGLTVDTSKLTNTDSQGPNFGLAYISDASVTNYRGSSAYHSTTQVKVGAWDDDPNGVKFRVVTQAFPFSFGSGDFVECSFKVPIAQWAGSSVNVANSQVEYAFNTSIADSSDTTSFGYGPSGQQANYSFSGNKEKRVRFLTPIQATDKVVLEFSQDRISWFPLPFTPTTDQAYDAYSGGTSGAGLWYVSGSSTDIDVRFGRYRSGTNAWNSVVVYWRVVKSSNPLSIGQIVTPTSQVICNTGNGYGSTNTKIRRFTNSTVVGSDITYADSASAGASFTINRAGVYAITVVDYSTAGDAWAGISLNSSQLTTNIDAITIGNAIAYNTQSTNYAPCVAATIRCNVGDVVRPHDLGANNGTNRCRFIITQVAI